MRSVADDLRLESRRATVHLSAADRIALALRLGDEDVARYRTVHRISEREARVRLARARQIGRVPSRANERDIR
jgi:hypothetical protein